MSDQRTEIIIKEINYWKKHNLLPAVQCDFLLALYTHGEGVEVAEEEPQKCKKDGVKLKILAQLFLLLIALLSSMIIIYAIELEFYMKLILLIILLSLSLFLYVLQKKNGDQISRLTISIMLILLLVMSLFVTKYITTNHWIINSVVIINFVMWFFVGRKLKLTYLMIMSVLAAFFSTFYIVFQIFVS